MKVGHPLDRAASVGPLIGPEPVDRALEAIGEAVDAGASLVLGDAALELEDCAGGFYMSPTILTNVDSGMRIAREELFAPVQVVIRWSSIDQAIELANGTDYGLCASIHTRDLHTALTMADALEVGSVAINGTGVQHWMGAPFGGPKASGIGGKEDSIDELLEATFEKNIFVSNA